VLWTQPVDSEIFASFRNDAQVRRALRATTGRPGRFGVLPSAPPGTSADIPERTADLSICVD
jgi:hypothetical protein